MSEAHCERLGQVESLGVALQTNFWAWEKERSDELERRRGGRRERRLDPANGIFMIAGS